jgi:hypothetical protein
MEDSKKPSIKEQRIKKIIQLYYSKPEIQKVLFDFSKDREVSPSYMMKSFGKRPDSFQYIGDIFELVKKGATSFHCSEEIWKDPLAISTDLNGEQLNDLRKGWDLLLDIDSKYIDYSKVLAKVIIEMLKFHGLKNVGIKFSGSKGFHLIVPWKAFPKKIYNVRTADMFPEWPRIILKYIIHTTKEKLVKKVTALTKPNKYVRDFKASEQVIPDLILVSPRHLFRMPYSLHEKTALASVVLTEKELENFDLKHADPLKAKVRDFIPEVKEGEAKELLMQALDWHKQGFKEEEKKYTDTKYKPIKLLNLSDKNFPPSIQKILQGIGDGRKRALFILLNLFRSVGMEREELEKRIYDWNDKNQISLKKGYIISQLSWSYRNKIVPPPNFSKDYYKGIGIIPTEEELKYKNPANYIIKKTLQSNKSKKKNKKTTPKKRDNFKKKKSL